MVVLINLLIVFTDDGMSARKFTDWFKGRKSGKDTYGCPMGCLVFAGFPLFDAFPSQVPDSSCKIGAWQPGCSVTSAVYILLTNLL